MKQRFTHPFLSFVQFFTALVLVAAALGVPQRTAQSASTIVYVVPGGAGDRTGTSWANARDLATALDDASSGMELWVKGGTYKPTAAFPMYPKQATFTLKSGVALYGGFAGTETVRDQRNPTANETILSGVIDSSTRITHVVTVINVDATAVLDGFKITDGKADGSESGVPGYQYGGGMYLENSSPTLANLIIRLNSAQYYGGGMHLTGSSPTLTNVTIENNTVSNGGGGGMYNLNSNPVLSTVSFNNNNAGSGMGGGILNYNSHPTLTGATFYSNTAGSGGGGISNSNGSSILLTNVTFEGNIATNGSGGGMDNIGSSSAALTNVTFHLNIAQSSLEMGGGGMSSNGGSVTLSHVTFESNSARSKGGGMSLVSGAAELTDVIFVGNSNASTSQTTYGGGMYIQSASPKLTRVIFRENANTGGGSQNFGGGLSISGSSPTLINVLFVKNIAKWGAGMYNTNSSPTLIQTTFSGNQGTCGVSNCGSGIYNTLNSSPSIQNSILWANTAGQVNNDGSVPHFANSIVQGSGGSGAAWVSATGADDGGNLDADPLFVALPATGVDGDLHLQAGSPAINNGLTGSLPAGVTTDLDGAVRVVGAAVDMGAYEFNGSPMPPQTTLTSQPSSPTKDRNPSFAFSSDTAGSTFKCKLDTGDWSDCASPLTFSNLPDGSHTFQVQAVVTVGGVPYVDWTPASATWTIDTTASVAIDIHPDSLTRNTSAEFAYSSPETATFQCQLDGSGWSDCTPSPRKYTSLTDGEHTFQVKATDSLGNVSAPASYTWRIDITAPETTIGSAPANPSNSTSASFTFSSNEANSTFQCRLDAGAWTDCSGSQSYSNLADGSHTFYVRAVDAVGNVDPSPATHDWTVAVPPDTTILTQPSAPINGSSATFTFSSSEANSTFECRLDSSEWTLNCVSPKEYTSLSEGAHTFDVRAIDPAGNVDPEPASAAWVVRFWNIYLPFIIK